jgi:hypothetical protein
MEQFRGKYLVQNRITKEIFETPQICYALIAATLFAHYPKKGTKTRLHWIKEYYDAISTHQISLPTPVMAGVRTPQRQFSSCVLVETDDSLDSINATTSAIVKYVSQKAGIGIGAGRIRALNSPIRSGDAYHTGVIPFYKHFATAVKSCSQGGVRSGCVQRDSYVEKIVGITVNGIDYSCEDIIIKDGISINIIDIIKTVAYVPSKESETYLQNMFSGNFTIEKTSNNDA